MGHNMDYARERRREPLRIGVFVTQTLTASPFIAAQQQLDSFRRSRRLPPIRPALPVSLLLSPGFCRLLPGNAQ